MFPYVLLGHVDLGPAEREGEVGRVVLLALLHSPNLYRVPCTLVRRSKILRGKIVRWEKRQTVVISHQLVFSYIQISSVLSIKLFREIIIFMYEVCKYLNGVHKAMIITAGSILVFKINTQ